MIPFEAVALDESAETGAHRFSAEEIKTFAAAWDPQRFHLDEAAAEETHFGKLAASGWHTAAVMARLLVDHFRARLGEGQNLGPSPGFDEMKWLKPVFAGDTITYSYRVTGKRLSESKPGWGLVTTFNEGRNQWGEPVFSVRCQVFLPARG
jgi:acyl dehydratase